MPFVASGTYGCVFSPALQCANKKEEEKKKKQKDTVSKVFRNQVSFEAEKKLESIIEIIDPKRTFTRPVYDNCAIVVNKKNASQHYEKCEHIHMEGQNPKYSQLVYKDGGNDLSNILSHKMTEIQFKKLIKTIEPLILGIKKIHKHGYVHLDIKPGNILHDFKKSYLIDFGLMTLTTKTYQKTHYLSYDYPYYPPEFKAAIGQSKGQSYEEFVSKFLLNFKYSSHVTHSAFEEYLNYTILEQKKDLQALYKASNIETYTDKIDIYSLGVVLMSIYVYGYNLNFKIIPTEFTKIIKGMVCFNPKKRLSIEDALRDYHRMVLHL